MNRQEASIVQPQQKLVESLFGLDGDLFKSIFGKFLNTSTWEGHVYNKILKAKPDQFDFLPPSLASLFTIGHNNITLSSAISSDHVKSKTDPVLTCLHTKFSFIRHKNRD